MKIQLEGSQFYNLTSLSMAHAQLTSVVTPSYAIDSPVEKSCATSHQQHIVIDVCLEETVNETKEEKQLRYLAHNFVLPHVVKHRLEADVKQANGLAITTALFAGALVSLAQLVATNETSSPTWEALRFFIYGAIAVNLSGTTLALIIIKMCTDIPCIALERVLDQPSSWPARCARGEPLPLKLLRDPVQMLVQFGMSRHYNALDWGAGIWVIIGYINTFSAMTLWVWLTQTPAVAVVLMVIIVPAFLGTLALVGILDLV